MKLAIKPIVVINLITIAMKSHTSPRFTLGLFRGPIFFFGIEEHLAIIYDPNKKLQIADLKMESLRSE
jgi:hypothetical protein